MSQYTTENYWLTITYIKMFNVLKTKIVTRKDLAYWCVKCAERTNEVEHMLIVLSINHIGNRLGDIYHQIMRLYFAIMTWITWDRLPCFSTQRQRFRQRNLRTVCGLRFKRTWNQRLGGTPSNPPPHERTWDQGTVNRANPVDRNTCENSICPILRMWVVTRVW